MPPNICKQHCMIRSSKCQNPCKGKRIYTNHKGENTEIDVLCSVHGKYHKRLCRTGNCIYKVFTEIETNKNKEPENKEK